MTGRAAAGGQRTARMLIARSIHEIQHTDLQRPVGRVHVRRGADKDNGQVRRVVHVRQGQLPQKAAAGVAAVGQAQAGACRRNGAAAVAEVDEHKDKLDLWRQPVQVHHDALVVLPHGVALVGWVGGMTRGSEPL